MRTASAVRLGRTILLLGLLTASAGAQEAPKDPRQGQEELPTFRTTVNVVNLFFNVKDKRGALIPNLTKDDFDVFEDGKPQTIKYFSAETNQPLTLGILIDTSASQMRVLPMEQDVGAAFLQDVLTPKDMAFVINFDINVELQQDFTSSARDLREALLRVKINSGGPPSTIIPGVGGGPVPQRGNPKGTLLYDAIFLAADEKLKNEVGRKAMIILTDGEDQGSMMTLQRAVEAAQRADAIVYILLIADQDFNWHSGDDFRKLATDTGGRTIEVGNKYKKVKEAFDQIAAELRSQYSIGYSPANTARDGTFRRTEVRSKQGHRVQTRKGYYAATK